MTEASIDVGAKWRHVSKTGEVRRYVLEYTKTGPPGLAVFLSCLEPAHPPVEGYRGGASREARILATTLRERPSDGVAGWLAGHA